MSVSSRLVYVQSRDLIEEETPTRQGPRFRVSVRRQLLTLAGAAIVLPALTVLLNGSDSALSLEGEVLLYLLAVVAIAVAGGIVVAVISAIAAALLINYYFVEPLHTLDVADTDQALALVVFIVVAGVISGLLELLARRARAAELASAQAETLSALAGADLNQQETLRGVLERARETFGMQSVVLKARDHASGEWADVEAAGWLPTDSREPLRFDVPINQDLRLVGRGPALFAEDQRVLRAFAGAAHTAFEGRQLSAQAKEARTLAEADAQRVALLAAVGHDLRTPLAGIKAGVTTLLQTDVDWSPEERRELLLTIDQSTDNLDGVVANLLDASRLQAGALSVQSRPVALDEMVGTSLLALPKGADVNIQVPDDLPLVLADPGLLERVLVNVLDNALRHGAGRPVEVRAVAGSGSAKIEIADHGEGVPAGQHERLFQAFAHLDDRSSSGIGLGLSVARGFVEAMDGAMVADTTPGGGLTIRIRLPLAGAAGQP